MHALAFETHSSGRGQLFSDLGDSSRRENTTDMRTRATHCPGMSASRELSSAAAALPRCCCVVSLLLCCLAEKAAALRAWRGRHYHARGGGEAAAIFACDPDRSHGRVKVAAKNSQPWGRSYNAASKSGIAPPKSIFIAAAAVRMWSATTTEARTCR